APPRTGREEMELFMNLVTSGRTGKIRALLLAGIGSLAAGIPATAFAQEPEEELALPAGEYQEEQADGNFIVVTATKREQTLQDTPVAVSVATGEQIERAAIRDLKDLQTIVPSMK